MIADTEAPGPRMSARARGPRFRRPVFLCLSACASLILCARCTLDRTATAREEKYVTVKLHDSLSRYDSVEILILAANDTNQVIGRMWSGPLTAPGQIPSYRLDDDETRPLEIRVRAFDANGALAMDMLITKNNGQQTVTDVPLAKPSTLLASLSVSPGALSPAFAPSDTAYSIALDKGDSLLSVTAAPAYAGAEMWIGVDKLVAGTPSVPITMRLGANRLVLSVSAGAESKQYILSATRGNSDDTSVVPPADTAHNPDLYVDWSQTALLSFNFRQVGISPGMLVTDFPLLVRLTKDNFDFSKAAAGGKDLRFATASGKVFPHQIIRWDASARLAEIFVKIDSLQSDNNTEPVLLFWGNPNAPDISDGSKVFPAAGGYSGVWHLEENGLGRSDEYADATGNYPGTAGNRGSRVPSRRDGVVSYGQDFNATGGQNWIELPTTFDPGPNAWSFSVWVRGESDDAKGILFAKEDFWDSTQQRFRILAENAGEQVALERDNSAYVTNMFLPRDTFTLLGFVYDGKTVSLYVDGAFRESKTWTQGSDSKAKAYLGCDNAKGGDGFQGTLDEVWVSSQVRPPAYMRLLYETQKPYSNFVTLLPL